MKRKKRNPDKKNQTAPKLKVTIFSLRKALWVLLVLSIMLNGVLFFVLLKPQSSIQKLIIAASKASYSISSPLVLRDVENPSFRIRVGDLWDQKLLRVSGQVALLPLPHFPDLALIVDSDVRIVSMSLLSPLIIGGSNINLQQYFAKFYGLGLEALAGNQGIFKPDDQDLTRFSERFKDALLKSLQMLYIKAKGKALFDQQFPQGIHFATAGDKLRSFEALDLKAQRITLQDLRGKKTALISVDTSCGVCETKAALMRDIALQYQLQVIFIVTGTLQRSYDFSEKYAPNERVIHDDDLSLTRLLYLGDAPSLMLIDHDLTVVHKAYVSDVANDAEPYFKLLGK